MILFLVIFHCIYLITSIICVCYLFVVVVVMKLILLGFFFYPLELCIREITIRLKLINANLNMPSFLCYNVY